MKTTGSNSFSCTNNGKTVVVKGANDASSAARQAFGPSGNKATVVQTTSK